MAASTSQGRISEPNQRPGLAVRPTYVPAPSKMWITPMSVENRNSAMRPSQKVGAEIARSDPIIVSRSSRLRGQTAEIAPATMPMLTQIATAPTVREIVACARRWGAVVCGRALAPSADSRYRQERRGARAAETGVSQAALRRHHAVVAQRRRAAARDRRPGPDPTSSRPARTGTSGGSACSGPPGSRQRRSCRPCRRS